MISKIGMKNRTTLLGEVKPQHETTMRFAGNIDLEKGLDKEGGIEIEIRDKTDSLGSTRKPLDLISTMRPSSSAR